MRRRLGWRLLGSYLLVVAVGSVVLWVTAEAAAPAAFARHVAAMAQMMGGPPAMMDDLFAAFLRAMNTALALAAVAAAATAVIVSVFVSRRIVAPVEAMRRASARIADGRYDERVPVTSDDELGGLAVQFNRMAASLEQVEQRRRDLVADVAHELRTPLSTIGGYVEAMLDGVFPSDPETLHRIQRETARLQRLLADLQDLSRAEAGQVAIHPRPMTVADLVDPAVARFRPQYEGSGVGLRAAVPAGLPRVQADPDRIGQVLTNLLGNALQYTPAGGRVEVTARRADGAVEVSVTDTGIGIASEDLPHLFDRFYRVDRSRSRASGGSGIGLTIARHLVEAHGGRISAASAGPGRGSTFAFTLPLAP